MQIAYHSRIPGMAGLAGPIDDFLSTPLGKQVKQYLISQLSGYAQNYAVENIKSIQFYTDYSEPLVYTGQDVAKMVSGAFLPSDSSKKKTGGLISFIKPTLVFDLKSGKKVIAPYGEATATGSTGNKVKLVFGILGVLALYSVGAYYLGYRRGRRSQ
jgi:hypothetical protein